MEIKLDGDTEKRIYLVAGKLKISYAEAYHKVVGVGLFVFETKEVLDKIIQKRKEKQDAKKSC